MSYSFPDGTYTVLVTPFNIDKSINYEEIKKWMAYQMSSKITGIVLMGTTSESPAISRIDQIKIIEFVGKLLIDYPKKYIIVGVGGSDTYETLDFSKYIVNYKFVDALMITVPAYNKPPDEGIIEHFTIISQNEIIKNTPIIMYNVPSRTGKNMTPIVMQQICNLCPNVVALKEAFGSTDQMKEIVELCPKLKVFSGDDGLITDFIKLGARGVISVASNVVPNFVSLLTSLCLDDKFDEAESNISKSQFTEFVKALFIKDYSNPISVKFMLHRIGLYHNYLMRLPMVPLPDRFKDYVGNQYLLKNIDFYENM